MLLNQIVSLYLVQEVAFHPPASVERFYIALFMYHSGELYVRHTLFFFYKNIFYKNIEAEICEILRIL